MKAKKTALKARRTSTGRTSPAKPTRRPGANKKIATKPAATRKWAKRQVAKRKAVRRAASLKFPPLLLQGDSPAPSPGGGPGGKYALGPTPPAHMAEAVLGPRIGEAASARQELAQALGSQSAELPEAYGTKRLFLTARDPHWLYAHWDFTREQQARYNQQSADGHLILRIHFAPPDAGLVLEVHVHPESRHWFAHVERAATPYTAEVGWYNKRRKWTSIARSGATLTPPETISDETDLEFATIPADLPFEPLLALVKTPPQTQQPLARAVEALRREGHPKLPPMVSAPTAAWTLVQGSALARAAGLEQSRGVGAGSLEITELLRGELPEEISSQAAAQLSGPPAPADAVPGDSAASSPFGDEPPARAKGFWLNVNAELIIYGATERDATVTIGGRQIRLRPDGSFSYRFALPDGSYDLPVVAVSAAETDGRAAELRFTRTTELWGDVGASPQDPTLKPPTPDDV